MSIALLRDSARTSKKTYWNCVFFFHYSKLSGYIQQYRFAILHGSYIEKTQSNNNISTDCSTYTSVSVLNNIDDIVHSLQ